MADSSLDVGIKESVGNIDMKMLGLGPDVSANMLYQGLAQSLVISAQNAVSQQQRMDQIGNAIVTQAVNLLINTDPTEAIAVGKEMSGNDLGQQLAQLLAVINSNNQGVKSAGNTPPVTP